MSVVNTSRIEQIRDASRKIVRELGFMKPTLAETALPPSAVYALLEVDMHGGLTAVELSLTLNLEKSSVSRMVRKLIEADELRESVSTTDGRVKLLKLTAKGRLTLKAINAYGRQQVSCALSGLSETESTIVSQGLSLYARALEAQRNIVSEQVAEPVHVLRGYRPGAIGAVTEMHARYYAQVAGFGQFFEQQVAKGMTEFVPRLDKPENGLWLAIQSGKIVGSVAIDGEDMGQDVAHLRWFIVDGGVRGSGVGKQLLDAALAFCDAHGFASTKLWTFQGLDAAHHLYGKYGFTLEEEVSGNQWGKQLSEQRFVRKGPYIVSNKLR